MDQAVNAAVRSVTGHTDFQSKFKHPVKFDGTNFVEQKLSSEEQVAEVSKLELHVLLERYGSLLQVEDLHALVNSPAADTAAARFWLEKLLQKPLDATALQKRNRRRRWTWARKEMGQPEGYFCEDEMKRRDPQLFHKVVGQYLDNSALKSSAPMEGSLSAYLMQQLDREAQAELGIDMDCAAKRRRHRPPDEDSDGLEDDEELEDRAIADLEQVAGQETEAATGGAPDDNAVRRAKLLKTMRERFINGAEEFDYKTLDDDSDLDDVVELGRDAEERYFDGD